MPKEGKKISRIDTKSAEGYTVTHNKVRWLVIRKERAGLVRPRQYPVARFPSAYILRLQNIETNDEIKVVVFGNGRVEEIELNMQHSGNRSRRRSTD